jgi:hypothetical protein
LSTLGIYGIDPAFLTIDGQPAVARPRPQGVVNVVAPPEVFDVATGWHALRYDLARASEAAADRGLDVVNHTGEPTIEARVNVPADGITLRRFDRALVDERGIQSRTGYTGGVIVSVPLGATELPPAAPMSLAHTAFMAVGRVALAAWAWHFLASDE